MTVALGVVHPGVVSWHFTSSLLASDRRPDVVIDERSGPLIASARNRVVGRFLESGCDWLWLVDSDMAWSPGALDRLLAVGCPESPIVGGLCFGTVEGRLVPTIFDRITLQGVDVMVRVGQYPRDRLVKVAATGAAFLLVHRDVLVAVRDAKFSSVFPWFQEVERDGEHVGEDVEFCLRAGEVGFPVLVDTRVKVGHAKSLLLTEALYDAQEA